MARFLLIALRRCALSLAVLPLTTSALAASTLTVLCAGFARRARRGVPRAAGNFDDGQIQLAAGGIDFDDASFDEVTDADALAREGRQSRSMAVRDLEPTGGIVKFQVDHGPTSWLPPP